MHENWLGTNNSGANFLTFFFRATPRTNFEKGRIRLGILVYRADPSCSDLERIVIEHRRPKNRLFNSYDIIIFHALKTENLKRLGN
jgi:hypothetical protein